MKKLPGHQNLSQMEGEFIKECLLSAGEIMCPEQKQAFANRSLTGNTVAQQVKDTAENLQDEL